jgi:hypothetical protein
LLDSYPRERLQAFTMGTDRCRRDDWHYVDASAASGKEIFAAVLRGRLWLNLLRVDLVDHRCGEAIRQLTSDLQGQCPRLGDAELPEESPGRSSSAAGLQPSDPLSIPGHSSSWAAA